MAKLARIESTHLLSGPAGLEARTKRIGEARRAFWSNIGFAAIMPAVLTMVAYPAPPPLGVLLLVEGGIGLMFLSTVGFKIRATPYLAQDTFYSNLIPLRAIWDRTELGQFGVSEVERVIVKPSHAGDFAWLDVEVHARSGRTAVFSGFPRSTLEAAIGRAARELDPKARSQLMAMTGGTEEVVEWAREHNIPMTEVAPPDARPPQAT